MDCQPSTSKIPLDKNISEEIETSGGLFKCEVCSLEENYEYKGSNPPFAKCIVMSEDCYMIEDPFLSPKSGEFLTLGSDCSICQKSVCKSSECSFFYRKTYCLSCVKLHLSEFPSQVQMKISKVMKTQ